jgi:hypothetical protein
MTSWPTSLFKDKELSIGCSFVVAPPNIFFAAFRPERTSSAGISISARPRSSAFTSASKTAFSASVMPSTLILVPAAQIAAYWVILLIRRSKIPSTTSLAFLISSSIAASSL